MCAKKGAPLKNIIYTEDQVNTLRGLLNGLTVTGIQNAKQVAVMAQALNAGKIEEREENTDGSKDSTSDH